MSIVKSPTDIIVWPCGSWCYRDEVYEFGFMGDDFSVIYFDTAEYAEFLFDRGYIND